MSDSTRGWIRTNISYQVGLEDALLKLPEWCQLVSWYEQLALDFHPDELAVCCFVAVQTWDDSCADPALTASLTHTANNDLVLGTNQRCRHGILLS